MYLYLIPAIAGLATLGLVFQAATVKMESGPLQLGARTELDRYRQFMFAADQFMRSGAAPGGAGAVSWEQIKAAPSTPPGMRLAQVPASWRLVVAADGSWVACTTLSERAASAIGQMLPGSNQTASWPVAASAVLAGTASVASLVPAEGFSVLAADSAGAALALAMRCAS
jgi:hypothetical protein